MSPAMLCPNKGNTEIAINPIGWVVGRVFICYKTFLHYAGETGVSWDTFYFSQISPKIFTIEISN